MVKITSEIEVTPDSFEFESSEEAVEFIMTIDNCFGTWSFTFHLFEKLLDVINDNYVGKRDFKLSKQFMEKLNTFENILTGDAK